MVNSISPVLLFVGNDSYSKEKALEELVSSLLSDSSRQLDYRVFYGGDSDISEILEYAGTIPLIAGKKIVVVKEIEELSREDIARLINYIKKPADSTCLVLYSDSDRYPDGIDDAAVIIRKFDAPPDREIGAWIKNFLSLSNSRKKISTDAIEALKELQGQNLLSLRQEIEKLVAFTGERDEINSDDIEEVVGKSLAVSAFDLTNAVEQNDMDGAMRIIRDLLLSGKKHYEITGLLCWYLRRLMRARMLLDKNEDDARILYALKIPRRYADHFLAQVKALDMAKIRSMVEVLLEADLDLKRTKYDPSLILEFAVMRMCLI